MPLTIYGLEPSDNPGDVRYVGQTLRSPRLRLQEHLRHAADPRRIFPVQRWIRTVLNRGALVIITVLATGGEEEHLEEAWIARLRQAGHRLVNATSGGPGVRHPSEETRARLSLVHKGKPKSAEHRAKIAAFQKAHPNRGFAGHHHTEEAKRLFSRAGTVATPETRAKMVAAHQGRVFSVETRAKIGAKSKGRFHSEESREKNRRAHLKQGKSNGPQ